MTEVSTEGEYDDRYVIDGLSVVRGPDNPIPHRRRYKARLAADVLVWRDRGNWRVGFYHDRQSTPMVCANRSEFLVESIEYLLEELADRPDIEAKNIWLRHPQGPIETLVGSPP